MQSATFKIAIIVLRFSYGRDLHFDLRICVPKDTMSHRLFISLIIVAAAKLQLYLSRFNAFKIFTFICELLRSAVGN